MQHDMSKETRQAERRDSRKKDPRAECLKFHRNLQSSLQGHQLVRSQMEGWVWKRSTSCSHGALEDLNIESTKASSTFVSPVRKSGAIWWTQWMPTRRRCAHPTWMSLVRCDGKDERTVCGKSKCRFASYECRTCGETIHLAAVYKSVIRSSENTVIDAPVVARTATRTVSADSRTARAQHVDENVTCELCASQLDKLSEWRVVTFQRRLKTKQMLEKSGL